MDFWLCGIIIWGYILKRKKLTLLAANILIVDDEQAIADLVEVYLKNENYNLFKFYN
ncbi:MAG: DNA-binding response regulator, partial [Desulfitobacterium hafniense]